MSVRKRGVNWAGAVGGGGFVAAMILGVAYSSDLRNDKRRPSELELLVKNNKQVRSLELRVGIRRDSGVERRDTVVYPETSHPRRGIGLRQDMFPGLPLDKYSRAPSRSNRPVPSYLHDSISCFQTTLPPPTLLRSRNTSLLSTRFIKPSR